jgi:ABC-type multidrug transport system permease subunit
MRKVGKVVSNIVNTFIVVAFFMLANYCFGAVLVGIFVDAGIEWISVTNLGMMVFGLIGGIIWAVFNRVTNKHWDTYYSEWGGNNGDTS